MTLSTYLAERQQWIDATLDRWVPAASVHPATIHEAMRYSLFAGGKRIRPLLCIAAAEAVGSSAGVEVAACTLELIHTYSLIHDDLPALDNDDLRRGMPTCHKRFGEAMAILAGDALLTLAFQVLAQLPHPDPVCKVRLVEELSTAAGTVGGMIGGQVDDLESGGKQPDAQQLHNIHRAKTGALLRASLRMGAIYAGATGEELAALSEYGEHAGLAFQIVDDVLDVEQSSEVLGKTAGKDAAQNKMTFPALYGLEESRRMAERERLAAHQTLQRFGNRSVRLAELADLIVQRRA